MAPEIDAWLRAQAAAYGAASGRALAPDPAALRRRWAATAAAGGPGAALAEAHVAAYDAALDAGAAGQEGIARFRAAARALTRACFAAARAAADAAPPDEGPGAYGAWLAAHRALVGAVDPALARALDAAPSDRARYETLGARHAALAGRDGALGRSHRALARLCQLGAASDPAPGARRAFGMACRAATLAYYDERLGRLAAGEH